MVFMIWSIRNRRQNGGLDLLLKESSLVRLSTRRTENEDRRMDSVTMPPGFSMRRPQFSILQLFEQVWKMERNGKIFDRTPLSTEFDTIIVAGMVLGCEERKMRNQIGRAHV